MARLLARRDVTVAVIAVLFAVQAIIRFKSHLSPEVAWYLNAGGRLLDGAALYEDVVEVNPPLGVWLAAVVAAIARAVGVNATVAIKALLLALTALSVGLAARFLPAATGIPAGARHLFLILLAALMLFVPGADFGQREHVVIVLATPWVLLRWNRLIERDVPPGLAVLSGVLAATGFWLKPHFLGAVLAIELIILFAARDTRIFLRIENLAILAFSVAYPVAISFTVSRHFVQMSTLSTRAYIPIYGVGFEEMVRELILPFALIVAAIAGADLVGRQLQLLRTLLVVAGASFVFAFMMQAGLGYQLMPGIFFLALAAALGLAGVASGDAVPAGWRQRAVVGLVTIAILAVFVIRGCGQLVAYQGGLFERVIAAEAPEARSVFIASTSVAHPFPLVEEKGLAWASRFPAQWLAPYAATALTEGGGPDDSIGRYLLDGTVGDLVAFAPDIVFVDERAEQPHFRETPLDYVTFWSADSRFRTLWPQYEKRGVAEGFGVYVRIGAPADP